MLESVALTTVAGYIGLSLGVGLLELINKIMESQPKSNEEMFFRHPEVSISVAVASLIVLIIAGLFAGSIPAKRALQIKPIEALREE
jgi:putative ABC transport system permease protein